MTYFRKRFSIISAIFEALIKPPETVDYPKGALMLPEGFRGALHFDTDQCIGCGLCVRNCPADALHMEKKSRDEYKLIHYPARCAYCGQCEDNCRHVAIYHSNQLVKPTDNPAGLIVVLKEKKEA